MQEITVLALQMIAWVPLLPFVSAALLIISPLFSSGQDSDSWWSERRIAVVASGALAIGFIITLLAARQLLGGDVTGSVAGNVAGNANQAPSYTAQLGNWMVVDSFQVNFGFYIDKLTLVMMGIITGVGFLIHCFSAGYMTGDSSYRRYFAYLNLFVAAMLVLVMGDSLLLLYLGWEGVGLCSFLLIGFWFDNPANGYAARKAFVVTRVGDTAMAIGLFLLYLQLGTLDIQQILTAATSLWLPDGAGNSHPLATITALLLLGGAVGKSAQLPLQTWLPDAMAGPTPVSALIHAATMVTAGVYLIARTHPLFELSSLAMTMVTAVGALTLFLAGCSAVVQSDIKRILAYSTISQIGYMFYALGVGAWSAGVFHLMTHAFFKALLFLAAGLVIISLHHQQDIFKMGGLRKKLPVSFWSFVIGCSCLAALPMTSGYFSKDAILLHAFDSHGPNLWWLLAVAGAFITGLYSFRLIFIVFTGQAGSEQSERAIERPDLSMRIPLIILSLLALLGGLMEPNLAAVFNTAAEALPHGLLGWLLLLPPLLGAGLAFLLWGGGRRPPVPTSIAGLHRWWQKGWGFDDVYNALIINPLMRLAYINRRDVIDTFYSLLSHSSHFLHGGFGMTQNGQLRWYVAATTGGAVILLALVLL